LRVWIGKTRNRAAGRKARPQPVQTAAE
jgi:hypothetical protein